MIRRPAVISSSTAWSGAAIPSPTPPESTRAAWSASKPSPIGQIRLSCSSTRRLPSTVSRPVRSPNGRAATLTSWASATTVTTTTSSSLAMRRSGTSGTASSIFAGTSGRFGTSTPRPPRGRLSLRPQCNRLEIRPHLMPGPGGAQLGSRASQISVRAIGSSASPISTSAPY